MPNYNVNQIYLGNFTDFDTIEGTNRVNESEEVAGWTRGTVFRDTGMKLLSITEIDTVRTGATALESDDYESRATNPLGADSIRYDLSDDGSNPVTSKIDSVFRWNVTVTRGDGSTFTTLMEFTQLQDGSVFTHAGANLTGMSIQSIRLDSFATSDLYGTNVARTISDLQIVCFAAGTMIRTETGERAISTLLPGDLVQTLDAGLQPLRRIGTRVLDSIDLAIAPRLHPIRIAAGALGQGVPARDLVVSPQHRILVRGEVPETMFGQPEVLIAAKHLLDLDGVNVAADLTEVEYHHMLFDHHHVVFADGAEAESMFTGKQALAALDPAQVSEVIAIFPELAETDSGALARDPRFQPSRPFINGREGRDLARRSATDKALSLQ